MFVGIIKRKASDGQEAESRVTSFSPPNITNSVMSNTLLKASAHSINMPPPANVTSLSQTMTKTHAGGLIKGGSYASFVSKEDVSSVGNNNNNDDLEGVMQLEEDLHPEGVKSQGSLPPAPPVSPQIDRLLIEEAEKKAADIVKKARAEAKKLIEETKLYSQSAFAQAETDGFNKGRERGFEEGKKEMSNLILQAKDVLNQAIRERELLIRSIEPEMAKLSVRIAEKIMRYQIDIDQGAVVNMINSALDTLKQREEIVIKVNQEDYYYAKEKKSVFASMVEGLKKLDVVVDSGVDRGGCIIETDLGNIDARISTQIHTLELVFDKVAEERKQENEEEASK